MGGASSQHVKEKSMGYNFGKYLSKKRGITRRRRRQFIANRNFRRYVRLLLKRIHPGQKLSKNAMNVMNNFMNDMLDRITQCASQLTVYAKRKTLRPIDIQAACKLVLPPNLRSHAHFEGAKAVVQFDNAKTKGRSRYH